MTILAFDLGAGSGRAFSGHVDGGLIKAKEIHRFPNQPVQAGQHLCWDILRLFHEIKQGILKAKNDCGRISCIGIDSWAVDFGLLDRNGELLGNPYHYRDPHTDGMMEEVLSDLGKEKIFSHTGIQLLPFNTIYQLYALKKANSPLLERAETLLMIPDLLRYFLTGEKKSEFTNATTTQLFNPKTSGWDWELISSLGLPDAIFAKDILTPGSEAGRLSPSVCEELGVPAAPVIAVGEHDTASAVVGVPAESKEFAYLICGTWSLIGTELEAPLMTKQALAWNFTNEGGVGGTFRFLKNIMGLWIFQRCQADWEKDGKRYTSGELVKQAARADAFASLIDPDDGMFLNPVNMPEAIQGYCRKTNQNVPETPGEIIRCVLESLALTYRFALERMEAMTGKEYEGLHMVGGGIHNELLCQYTANVLARKVWAGPSEASAIGNIAVQALALDLFWDVQEARHAIRRSFSQQTYEPEDAPAWDKAYKHFKAHILGALSGRTH
ncbi:rhamnulokinase [Bacillus sonorensis]|uniref:Rhamnulokinase YulC n=2 Tax=Bacillus sonorensis TaxID=119858 RepID=M5NZ81_9BACI|nr:MULTISPECIES: rhamnulokinase family protein [Bacillus]TWK79462.1 Rhamnulokinase [Bacillus paralicheniformis]ASB90793.1 Rhamnulokinase [Bacillus sonorensis]EME73186.1 rhamnulokinase YulC [Bacillus sonorensis L12]MCY8270391.1 rhamnulokinase [Bacillus sonorensis]MCY8605152.1 rhamnulokinase [Bacillus sonorensis]